MVTAPIWNRYVESAAERYGVPPALVNSVIGVESGGQAGAVSGKGAGGYMQLMPDTFAELQKKHGLGPDRFDPETNINAGTAYMAQLYKQFGNWPDALAAYNAGPNRWAQVKAGTREAPRETQAYVPKVLAGFGQGAQTRGADVAPGLTRPQPGRSSGMGPMFGAARPNQSLTGLLEVEDENNFHDGLGNLLNFGQTESQPPRTDPAAMPGATQTDRMDVSGRINELLSQYLQKPQAAGPSQLQYALAGAQKGIAGLAGVHDRRVGIGEMLAGLGGGVTTGGLAYDEAQRQQRVDQVGEIGTLAKLQGYQRTEATAARQMAAANAFADRLEQAGQKDLAAAVRGNPSLMDEVVKAQAASIYPKEGGGYSLSPGQTRYGPNNQPVASVAPTQDATTTPLSAAEVQALGLPVGTVAQRDGKGAVSIVKSPDKPPEDRTFAQAKDLRTEFITGAKPFIEVRDAYGRLETAYKSGQDAKSDELRGPADIGMVFGYMKMLDPGSVVREGEYATVTNSGGVPETIRNMYNKVVGGGVLTEDIRKSLIREAQALYTNAEKSHGQHVENYRGLATRAGVKPEDVVTDQRRPMADLNKAPGASGGGAAPPPSRAVNPTTGETIEWNGSAWAPVK